MHGKNQCFLAVSMALPCYPSQPPFYNFLGDNIAFAEYQMTLDRPFSRLRQHDSDVRHPV